MIKVDLARIVHERHGGISHAEAQQLVELILETIKARLARGESVKLAGFGSLNVIHRRERMGRNPQTGERILLPASKYVTYRPSRLLDF